VIRGRHGIATTPLNGLALCVECAADRSVRRSGPTMLRREAVEIVEENLPRIAGLSRLDP